MEEFLFVEKYRPHKIEDCILPCRLKSVFQEYVKNENIPNLMLTGTAGCGKTTVAKLVAERLGRPVVDTDHAIEASTGR